MKQLIYWLMGERAGCMIAVTWSWFWGLPVASVGKIGVSFIWLRLCAAASSTNKSGDRLAWSNNAPKFQSAMRSSNKGSSGTNWESSFIDFHFQSRPLLCCVLTMLLVRGGILFLYTKVCFIVLPIAGTRLGINSGVGIALLIAMLPCCLINIPLYVVAVCHSQVRYELFPIWLLRLNSPAYKARFQLHTFVGINVAGGLIPLVLALYQFSRTSPSAILAVAAIIAVISYFFVTVVPGMGVYTKFRLLWLISLIAALAALRIVGTGHAAVSVAFAGGVLGTLIGADLLHLKDLQPEKAIIPISIGGARLNDGIALCGLYSLLIAEWIPNLFTFLKL